MLPMQSHGKRSLVDGSLQSILKHLGVDEGAGRVEHLAYAAQDITRCVHTYLYISGAMLNRA